MTVTSGGNTVHSEAFTYDDANGNLSSKSGLNYTYSSTHPHAAVALGSNTYAYDANGNQITRLVDGITYTLTFDGANQLVRVQSDAPFSTATPAPTASPTAAETPTEPPTVIDTPAEMPAPTATAEPANSSAQYVYDGDENLV